MIFYLYLNMFEVVLMKAIVCEMCDGRDIIKENGFYVCQSCGTKYSVEEAKKLMVELQGSVTIDKTQELNNLLTLADKARSIEDYPQAQKYYEQILLIDPQNWEAFLFGTIYAALNSTNKTSDLSVVNNCIRSSLITMKDYFDPNSHENIISTILQNLYKIEEDRYQFVINEFLTLSRSGGSYMELLTRWPSIISHFESIIYMLERFASDVLELFGNKYANMSFCAVNECVCMYNEVLRRKKAEVHLGYVTDTLEWFDENHMNLLIEKKNQLEAIVG